MEQHEHYTPMEYASLSKTNDPPLEEKFEMHLHRVHAPLQQPVPQPLGSAVTDLGLSFVLPETACNQPQSAQFLNLIRVVETPDVSHLGLYPRFDLFTTLILFDTIHAASVNQ